ncbi:MAG: hypothetical protein GC146_08085 [Limimaricola sp.]|uniref:calcium-binding protein n=1 Tax=Limimaricola sp. TaxID=2211665 RepID=UPI001D56A23A|nr:sialate O-acetylesterase [Limimaricola sp.]MBI1417164.1 hypothetical protein [Limimaricola sp.]
MSGVPIVIIAGQSNAKNDALVLGASATIQQNGGLALNYAISGSPLSSTLDNGNGDWSEEHLATLIDRINWILTPGSPGYIEGAYVSGMIWVQGEADSATADAAAAYADNLMAMRDQLTSHFGPFDISLAALSADVWTLKDVGLNREDNWLAVRDAQLGFAGQDGMHVVDVDALAATEGLTTSQVFHDDLVHYVDPFAHDLGVALVDQLSISGDVHGQTGTSGNDSFIVTGGGVQQVVGGAGTDLVDLSGLDHGVRISTDGNGNTGIENYKGGTHYEISTTGVEKFLGTDYNDLVYLDKYVRDVRMGDGHDQVEGSNYNDSIRLDGGDDLARGGLGNDFIDGGAGNDRVFGQDGNDRLYGGSGDDLIVGGKGDDMIYGGSGNDDLRPQAGHDTIIFNPGHNGIDSVSGFSVRDDIVDFRPMNVTADNIHYTEVGKDLVITVDDGRSDASVTLVNQGRYLDAAHHDAAGMPDGVAFDWVLF